MNMSKKMKTISIMWGMIVITLFIIVVLFSVFYKSRIKKYEALVSEMVNVTKAYVEDNNLYPVEGSEIKINLSELQEKELIDDLKVKNDTCQGFVIVKNDEGFKYNGYISCKMYVTKGYKKAK